MSTIDTLEWKPPTTADFARYFQTDLAPVLQACEQDRQATARNVYLLIGVVAGLAIVAGALVMASAKSPGPLLFVAMVAVAISGIGYSMVTRGFKSRYKQNVITPIVQFFGSDFTYDPAGSISESQFQSSRIFDHSIDRYKGEDFIGGTAGKTRFECSEVHAEYKTTSVNSKGHRRTQWHTIFKGLFFIADFNKHFNGMTLVLPDTAQATLGWLGQKLQGMNFSRPGDLVKLEDPEFEKLFVVYSTDQIEARYILSPSLMRRLVEFRRKVNHPVHLSFARESVYVAVNPGRDLLEPRLFSPVDFDICRENFADLLLVLSIIEELNLNTRIWSKQ